jgi:hypothetical protein
MRQDRQDRQDRQEAEIAKEFKILILTFPPWRSWLLGGLGALYLFLFAAAFASSWLRG